MNHHKITVKNGVFDQCEIETKSEILLEIKNEDFTEQPISIEGPKEFKQSREINHDESWTLSCTEPGKYQLYIDGKLNGSLIVRQSKKNANANLPWSVLENSEEFFENTEFTKSYGPLMANIPEIISIQHGLRLLFMKDVSLKHVGAIEKTCAGLQLHSAIDRYKQIDDSLIQDSEGELAFVFISKDDSIAQKGIDAWRNINAYDREKDREELASLLGYPRCCSQHFYGSLDREWGLVHQALLKSDQIHWELKSLFVRRYLNQIPYHLISHIPCSFDCSESLTYAQKLYHILHDLNPEFAESLKNYLSYPVLYFGEEKGGFVFKGKSSGKEIAYEHVLGLGKMPSFDQIKKANTISISEYDVKLSTSATLPVQNGKNFLLIE